MKACFVCGQEILPDEPHYKVVLCTPPAEVVNEKSAHAHCFGPIVGDE